MPQYECAKMPGNFRQCRPSSVKNQRFLTVSPRESQGASRQVIFSPCNKPSSTQWRYDYGSLGHALPARASPPPIVSGDSPPNPDSSQANKSFDFLIQKAKYICNQIPISNRMIQSDAHRHDKSSVFLSVFSPVDNWRKK